MSYDHWKTTNPADEWLEPDAADTHSMNIQEAYNEAMDEIASLKKLLELRDIEIGALRREIRRRNTEVDKLKTHIRCLCDAFEAVMDPANAPLRKLVAGAREDS
jgi:predicted  nucleic acid-binding Zn-ribbon protein